MHYSICFSPTGGTKKVCDLICEGFGVHGHVIDLCEQAFDGDGIALQKEDLCIIAAPAFKGRIPPPESERIRLLKGNGAKAVLVVTYGNRAYDDSLVELYDVVKESGFTPIAAITAVTEHSVIRSVAAGRPDADDEIVLKEYAVQIAAAVKDGTWRELPPDLPGNRPYLTVNWVHYGLKLKSACRFCGICARRCPTGAISASEPEVIDGERCIDCMRCVEICPVQARVLPAEKETQMRAFLEPQAIGRKPNRLFLSKAEGGEG